MSSFLQYLFSWSWQRTFALILLLILGAWLYNNYHRIETYEKRIDYGYNAQARSNDLLASSRLLETYGYKTKRMKNIGALRDLDSMNDHTIWLLDGDVVPDSTFMDDLLVWTENGGHLIVGLSESMSEPLTDMLDSIGIEAYTDSYDIGFKEDWENLYEDRLHNAEDGYHDQAKNPHQNDRVDEIAEFSPFNPEKPTHNYDTTVTFVPSPNHNEAITVRYENTAELYIDEPPLSSLKWYGTDAEGIYVMAQVNYGDGKVSVLGDPQLFSNAALQGADNGYFLLTLLQEHPTSEVHYLIDIRHEPGLLGTLWQRFPVMIVMFGLALLAWVIKAATRLGPVRTEVPASRANLLSHLRARGHFWRRRGNTQPLSRQAALVALNRRFPSTLNLSAEQLPDEPLRAIANELRCSPAVVKHALSSKPLAARDLPEAGRVLQHILHHSLPRSSNSNGSRP